MKGSSCVLLLFSGLIKRGKVTHYKIHTYLFKICVILPGFSSSTKLSFNDSPGPFTFGVTLL